MPSAPAYDPAPEIDEYALRRVEYRVRRLALAFRLRHQDAEDIRQDLTVELWRALQRYDPARAGVRTYVNRVLDRAYCHAARRLSARRRRGAEVSLDRAACVAAVGGWSADRARDALDLEDALAGLPRRLRLVAEELKHRTPREAAERLGVHRGTVYRAIAQIRAHLRARGVGERGAPAARAEVATRIARTTRSGDLP